MGKINLGKQYAITADRLARKHGKKYGVYACPHCGGTHVTTKLDKAHEYEELLYITE